LNWTIEYTPASQKQLRRLDPQVKTRIVRFMRERVLCLASPYDLGKQLTGKWSGHWRYRVGDYRVVCQIRNAELVVSVVKASHRSDVYLNAP